MTEAAAAQPVETTERVDVILDVTAEILAEAGYDGLQLRDVARRARVSLSTIYDRFPSRHELILAAVERWAAERLHRSLPPSRPDEPLYDALVRLFRTLFEPWERSPTMLAVMVRTTLMPGGERIWSEGNRIIRASDFFDGYDPAFIDDVGTIINYLTLGLVTACASGRIDAAEMRAVFEQAAFRLTADVEPQCAKGIHP